MDSSEGIREKYELNLLTKKGALALLLSLNAPKQLLLHSELVGEVAEEIMRRIKELDYDLDEKFVRVGVIIHDIGKIIYPCELFGAGNKHEAAGEKLLLSNDVCPKLARCCLSHGRYKVMKCSFEELIIALSDNLWKGARNHSLEFEVSYQSLS